MPNVVVTPVLGDHVSRVDLSVDVEEGQDPMSNALSDAMKRQHDMPFVKLGMRVHGAVDDALVVTKHDALAVDRDTEMAKGVAQI